ncbi:hypothetical protein EAD89_26610 [Micromonospora sp. BL4]|nr:hypothetical protein EAD89_26610 [Micromonospora sp. BL4]
MRHVRQRPSQVGVQRGYVALVESAQELSLHTVCIDDPVLVNVGIKHIGESDDEVRFLLIKQVARHDLYPTPRMPEISGDGWTGAGASESQ